MRQKGTPVLESSSKGYFKAACLWLGLELEKLLFPFPLSQNFILQRLSLLFLLLVLLQHKQLGLADLLLVHLGLVLDCGLIGVHQGNVRLKVAIVADAAENCDLLAQNDRAVCTPRGVSSRAEHFLPQVEVRVVDVDFR